MFGCEGDVPSLPDGDPAVLEPGYVLWPPVTDFQRYRVPGCRPDEPRKSTSPTIEILSSGGIAGGGFGNMQIWEDGTVLFDGLGCPGGSRRRGKMSAARVRALIDRLEDARFFMWPCDDEARCDDSFTTALTLHHGGATHTVVHAGCDSNVAEKAIELVMKTVGKNACSPWCLDHPTLPYCR
jgi:hypothetical protein